MNKPSKNFLKIKRLYKGRCEDLTLYGSSYNHYHCHIKIGDIIVSVVQEHTSNKINNLEYAILYKNELIYLVEHGDSVARFQTLEQVIEVIEGYIKGAN